MDAGLPPDIRPQWLSVVRRLQSVARRDNHGLAVLTIAILVDADGKPVQWTEPKRTLIEPKASAEQLLALLTERSSVP